MDERSAIFGRIQAMIEGRGLTVASKDQARPWGGFFVIDESQATAFIEAFFPGEHAAALGQPEDPHRATACETFVAVPPSQG